MAHLQRLGAPWRNRFLAHPQPRRCIFCAAKRSRANRAHYVVARGRHVFTILNLYPYNNGHVMIAPCRHVGTLTTLAPAEWSEMLQMSQRIMTRLTRLLRAQGFNVGMNLGRV